MPEERGQRRLVAILAADVVGFSRLMEQDEAGTMALLRRRRETVLVPVVAQHGGRVFKLMGDGVLIEFTSVVNAVKCAVDLQKAMQAQNVGMPAQQQVVLRIGINLGDLIVEGSDLYGKGVNLAARLEALAEPAGSASRATSTGMSRACCIWTSRTWANRGSRTLPSRCMSIGFRPATDRARRKRWAWPDLRRYRRRNYRSPYCRSPT